MLIQPLRDRIVVLQDPERADITSTSIVIKASKGIVTSQTQFGRTGTIHAVGPEARELKVGERVCYGEFVYPEYVEGGIRYLVMQAADICGVVE